MLCRLFLKYSRDSQLELSGLLPFLQQHRAEFNSCCVLDGLFDAEEATELLPQDQRGGYLSHCSCRNVCLRVLPAEKMHLPREIMEL